MKKNKFTFIKVLRRLIQIASFVLIPGLFMTAFGALKDVYQAIITGSFSAAALSYQLLILLAVIPVTILLGRFFCGYLCSFGSMSDFLWFISGKIMKKRPVIGENTDRFLKSFKFILLAFIVVFIWTLGSISIDPTANPWTIFGMYATFSGWPAASYLLTIGGGLLLLIIIGSLFVERFFCRYACPLGAVFSVVSLIRPFKIKKPRDECGACKLCTSNCPMGIALYKTDVIRSGECINCFNCIESCHRNNVKAKVAPPVAAACAAASIAGLYYVGNLASSKLTTTSDATAVTEISAVSTVTEESGSYTDGTYEGSAAGFRGTTTVEVTVQNGYIEDITVISTDDDAKYFDRVENSVVAAILLSQCTDVSTVSGATFSSNAIIDAVADALCDQMCATSESGASCQVTDDNETDVATAEETAVAEETAAVEETTTTEDAQTGESAATEESTAISYTDGVYSGTGTGFNGEVSVTVTVSGGEITDITIVSHSDDTPYMSRAEAVINSILETQELDVSTVSGATYSSNGILEAVADALELSYTSTVSEHTGGGHNHGGGH